MVVILVVYLGNSGIPAGTVLYSTISHVNCGSLQKCPPSGDACLIYLQSSLGT